MKHQVLKWNQVNKEWFCAKCGRTSDHGSERDAQAKFLAIAIGTIRLIGGRTRAMRQRR